MSARRGQPRRGDVDASIDGHLDMLAAERGAGDNTLAAYGRDLADLADDLAHAKGSITRAGTGELRAYLGRLARRGMRASAPTVST